MLFHMIEATLFIFGTMFGSFVNALVWRMHENTSQSKNNHQFSILRGRSMCPKCEHQLAAFDLIPIVSWLFLGGKCRYCGKPISWQYPLVEFVTGILFVVSYAAWPYLLIDMNAWAYSLFVFWFLLVTVGVSLAVYDIKWMILPNRLVYTLGIFSVFFVAVLSFSMENSQPIRDGLIGSILFGGLFYILYQISAGKWIGGGDVRLGFMLGLLLGWQKSIVALSAAAYLGTAIIIALICVRKYHRQMKLPFGPLLLIGAYVTFLWGQGIIDWYLRLSGL